MKNLGTFQAFQYPKPYPADVKPLIEAGVIFYHNEAQIDFYSLHDETGNFVALQDNEVVAISDDISKLAPDGLTILQLGDGDVKPEVGWSFDGQTFLPPKPPTEKEVIKQAHDQINAIADQVYTKSTSLDRRYANKRAEALRFIEAGKPAEIAEGDYPYLVKEARAREVEPSVLADLIISMASGFDAFGSDAEEARAAVTVAVNKADPDQRQSATQAIVDDLKAKADALA